MAAKHIRAGLLALSVACLTACGSKEKTVVVRDPAAEALAYVPADAPAVAVVQTGTRAGAGAALAGLATRVPGAGLALGQVEGLLGQRIGLDPATELQPLRGNPLVVWAADASAKRWFAAWVVTDADKLGSLLDARKQGGELETAGASGGFTLLVRKAGGAYARRGPILIAGPDLPALRAVLARRASGRGQWTPSLLGRRRLGLPGGAAAELLADARPFRARGLGAPALRVPWVAALQRVAVTLGAERGGLRVRARASTDAAALAPGDVPIAGGVAPPASRGAGPLVVAVRDPQHLLAFLRKSSDLLDPHRLDGLRTVEDLLGRYARVDLQDDVVARLTGTATLTSADLRTGTVRSDLTDAGAVSGVLERLGTLARLGGPLAGLAGVDLHGYGIDERDGGEVITRDGHDVVALAVTSGALVASTAPGADLAAAGAARAAVTPPPPAGALRATAEPGLWTEELIRRFGLPPLARIPLAAFGRLAVTAWGERSGLDVQVVVPVAG